MRPHTTIADRQTALHNLMTALGYTATAPGSRYSRKERKGEIFITVQMQAKGLWYSTNLPLRLYGRQGIRCFADTEHLNRIINNLTKQFEKCPH